MCFLLSLTLIEKQILILKANQSVKKICEIKIKWNVEINITFFCTNTMIQLILSVFFSFFLYLRMEYPSIETCISVDWCFIFFAQQNSLTSEVHVLDKHNRELFYKDIKSNAIMVSYDSLQLQPLHSINKIARSFVCHLLNLFSLVHSNYQLKSTQTLYALRSDRTNKDRTISITYVFDSSSQSRKCTATRRRWREKCEVKHTKNVKTRTEQFYWRFVN